jgi:hypothetical protein
MGNNNVGTEEVTVKAIREKSFTNVGRSVSLPKGITLKEMLCK